MCARLLRFCTRASSLVVTGTAGSSRDKPALRNDNSCRVGTTTVASSTTVDSSTTANLRCDAVCHGRSLGPLVKTRALRDDAFNYYQNSVLEARRYVVCEPCVPGSCARLDARVLCLCQEKAGSSRGKTALRNDKKTEALGAKDLRYDAVCHGRSLGPLVETRALRDDAFNYYQTEVLAARRFLVCEPYVSRSCALLDARVLCLCQEKQVPRAERPRCGMTRGKPVIRRFRVGGLAVGESMDFGCRLFL